MKLQLLYPCEPITMTHSYINIKLYIYMSPNIMILVENNNCNCGCILGKVFGTAIKTLGNLFPLSEYLHFSPVYVPGSSFLLKHALGGISDDTNTWVPAMCMVDLV